MLDRIIPRDFFPFLSAPPPAKLEHKNPFCSNLIPAAARELSLPVALAGREGAGRSIEDFKFRLCERGRLGRALQLFIPAPLLDFEHSLISPFTWNNRETPRGCALKLVFFLRTPSPMVLRCTLLFTVLHFSMQPRETGNRGVSSAKIIFANPLIRGKSDLAGAVSSSRQEP